LLQQGQILGGGGAYLATNTSTLDLVAILVLQWCCRDNDHQTAKRSLASGMKTRSPIFWAPSPESQYYEKRAAIARDGLWWKRHHGGIAQHLENR
jgi:hypothetical protein